VSEIVLDAGEQSRLAGKQPARPDDSRSGGPKTPHLVFRILSSNETGYFFFKKMRYHSIKTAD
jgi:hypothetical protein